MIYDYLAHNEYQQHVDKIVALYKEQSDAMLAAIKEYFPANVKYTEPEGGMFIWVTLPEGMSALKLFHKAMEKKVAFVPGDPFYVGKSDVNTFRLTSARATSTPSASTTRTRPTRSSAKASSASAKSSRNRWRAASVNKTRKSPKLTPRAAKRGAFS